MSDTTATAATARKKRDFSIGRLLLEGRAFFALIAIIVIAEVTAARPKAEGFYAGRSPDRNPK